MWQMLECEKGVVQIYNKRKMQIRDSKDKTVEILPLRREFFNLIVSSSLKMFHNQQG